MPNQMKIPININMAQVRKSFREMNKLQQKAWKVRQRQIRIEARAEKREEKAMLKEHKLKQRFMKEELDHSKKLRNERGQFIKREETFSKKQRRESDRDYRKTRDRMRGMDRQAKKMGIGRRTARGAKSAAIFGAGGMMGFLMGYMMRAQANYYAAQNAMQPVVGTGFTSGNLSGGSKWGWNKAQRAGMAPGMARATGATTLMPLMQGIRATGMNAGEVTGMFGAMSQGGTSFKGNAGKAKREFAQLIEIGVKSGVDRGKLPNYFQGLQTLMQKQIQMTSGDVSAGGFAKIAGLLGQSQLSGFRDPTRRMSLMGKLQQGILTPGGGEAGMAFMRQAFGFGRPGGGGRSFYQAERKREEGLTPENFQTVMQELTDQYGTGEDAVLKLRETFQTDIKGGEELIRLFQSGGLGEEGMAKLDEIMSNAGSLEKQAATQMRKAATALAKIARRFDSTLKDGRTMAKASEKIEDWQKKLFDKMMEWMPKLLGFMKDLVGVVKAIWAWIQKRFKDAKDIVSGTGKVIGAVTGSTGKKVAKKMKEAGTVKGDPDAWKSIALGVSAARTPEQWQAAKERARELGDQIYESGTSTGQMNIGGKLQKGFALSRGEWVKAAPSLYRMYFEARGINPLTANWKQRAAARKIVHLAKNFKIKKGTFKGHFDTDFAEKFVREAGNRDRQKEEAETAVRETVQVGAQKAADVMQGVQQGGIVGGVTAAMGGEKKLEVESKVIIEPRGEDPKVTDNPNGNATTRN